MSQRDTLVSILEALYGGWIAQEATLPLDEECREELRCLRAKVRHFLEEEFGVVLTADADYEADVNDFGEL